MKLDQFYSLRATFTIIGLTGHVGSGCSKIASVLADPLFLKQTKALPDLKSSNLEDIKYGICFNYLQTGDNWKPFQIINYKDVLLLHLIHESTALAKTDEDVINKIIEIVTQNGKRKDWKNRYDIDSDKNFFEQEFKPFLKYGANLAIIKEIQSILTEERLSDSLKKDKKSSFNLFYDGRYKSFAFSFYEHLNRNSIIKRSRLTHDLANNLRANGTVVSSASKIAPDLNHIYTIAESINQLIKVWRSQNHTTKIVIDALKNSLELMYFKEKYAAFYMVASNKNEDERRKYLREIISKKITDPEQVKAIVAELITLDNAEFKSKDFSDGKFSTPDIENCIQKSDYHIFNSEGNASAEGAPGLNKFNLESQIIRFVALINQPGIVTPSVHEHFMQVAYNAKFNSGCISRQVGAVVTDANYSIKAIGWNDVPEGQVPCSLRNVKDLVSGAKQDLFTEYEKNGGDYNKQTFVDRTREVIATGKFEDLNDRNCSFCFKQFHNAFEGEKNQVHTRSLHAEENAMMQITKFGGQGIKGGNLYTTASPCELCSKKAYQLGIKNVFYIDPYPGIAETQILQGGIDKKNNPNLIMFQGAVGRAFHKLYEPFMAYKDEVSILTGIKPKVKAEDLLRNLISNREVLDKMLVKLAGKTEPEKTAFLETFFSKVI